MRWFQVQLLKLQWRCASPRKQLVLDATPTGVWTREEVGVSRTIICTMVAPTLANNSNRTAHIHSIKKLSEGLFQAELDSLVGGHGQSPGSAQGARAGKAHT